MNKDITFSEQCDNSSLDLSLFGSLLASTDTGARDDLVETGTIQSRFRKNRDNWIFIFEESPTTWISPSNKYAKSEKCQQLVIRYMVNLSYFELGHKKSLAYDTWWLLVTWYFYDNVEINLKNIYKHNTYRTPWRIFSQETDFFKETRCYLMTMHSNQLLEVSFITIILEKIVAEFDTVSSRITTRGVDYNHV